MPASIVSVSFQLDASPLGAGESSLKTKGAISRGLPARLAPLIKSSLECPRRIPSGLVALICGGADTASRHGPASELAKINAQRRCKYGLSEHR